MARTVSGLLSIETGIRTTATRAMTDAYHALQKSALLAGYSKVYQAKDEDATEWDVPPNEGNEVQVDAEALAREVLAEMAKWFNVMSIKESTNAVARADLVVDGQTILAQVPTTYLLFLERQLVDIMTFVSKLPVLDPAESWDRTEGSTAWASTPVVTMSTRKVPRNHVLSEATEKHPAQVKVYEEDMVVGKWTRIKFSGAVPAQRVADMVARVRKLQEAVKMARDEANRTQLVTDLNEAGTKVLAYVLG